MYRYLNPKTDLTFKRIFADHPFLLINFIYSVMSFEAERYIIDLEYLPSEMVPENPRKKFSIVDVRCKDNFGRQFIVEMQGFWQKAFFNRIVFNAGTAYVKQLDSAEELCERGAYTPEELAKYDGFLDAVRIENTRVESARKEGRQEGEAIVLEKRKAERDQLKAELKASHENVVIYSHKAGFPIETILSITGLAPEQIIEILKRHGLI